MMCLFCENSLELKDLLLPQNIQSYIFDKVSNTEAVTRECSVKHVFLEISENSQETVSFEINLQAEACRQNIL